MPTLRSAILLPATKVRKNVHCGTFVMLGLGGAGGHLVPSTGGVGGYNGMEGRMAGESLRGPIILILGEKLISPCASEVKKKISTFSNSFATRGLCEKQILLFRCPRSDADGGSEAQAVCQLWKVLCFCSSISSLALSGSRGSGGSPTPCSRIWAQLPGWPRGAGL